MSHTLSFTELDAQHVELLPARTVLSVMLTNVGSGNGNGSGNGGDGGTAVAFNSNNGNGSGNFNGFGFQSVSGNQVNVAQADAHGGDGYSKIVVIHKFW